ncbi:hypothetical protein [Syntrophobacter fumaroxidans]|uniref:hypothetical protein n=1 Tax=Syntrophobacter fumaroxidans TaxID=119484 RepID=UPI0003121C73|nr:hypothetical protein [Syntrophobacter fumaroxidans]
MPEGVTVSGFSVSTTIHALLTPSILLWTGGIAMAAMLVLSLVPMRRIGRLRMTESLR